MKSNIDPTKKQYTAENWLNRYIRVRKHSEEICKPLQIEDYVVQPIVDVSPPKWHLGHTTWFFETFILRSYSPDYQVFNAQYNFVFNSYYETIGARVIRTDRGNLSRPSVSDIYAYRKYVDQEMSIFLQNNFLNEEVAALLELGINHEQQHQELLFADIKYILGHNPLFPAYKSQEQVKTMLPENLKMVSFSQGVYEIGFKEQGFCFDNELGAHKVYLNDFEIADRLVTNGEFLEFMKDGGYSNFKYWHSEGWDWVNETQQKSPLYWHFLEQRWMVYTMAGLVALDLNKPVCHVSYYEASAFAAWKGMRLPTEAEWEVAADAFQWGMRWEWTNSAYLPYPDFKTAAGAAGEYNGKFMVNQMVLRGASEATPDGHSRKTYRTFFQTALKWQFTGIRLAK